MSSNLKGMALLMKATGSGKLDTFAAVTGRKGMGKTTYAINQTREYLNLSQELPAYTNKRYIAFDNPEMQRFIHQIPEESPIIWDEAARGAMGEDWNKLENKELKKLSAQIRPKKLKIFMCIPRFQWLDKKYREDIITHWVWIPTRGHAVIFTPDDNPGSDDVWHMKDFKRMGRIDMMTDIEVILAKVRKHPCYFDHIEYPEVPQSIYEDYMKLRDQHVFEKQDEYVDQRQLATLMAFNLKYRWAEIMGIMQNQRRPEPTFDLIGGEMMKNPFTGRGINTTTVMYWIKQLRDKLSGIAQRKLVQEVPEYNGVKPAEL